MNKLIAFIFIWVILITPPAEAGIATTLLKHASKIVAKGATVSDDAVKMAAREALEECPELAKAIKPFGADSIELVAKILKDPKSIKIIENYGDDAATALLKNGTSAVHVIENIPNKELVTALKTLSRKESQELAILTSRGTVTPQNAKLIAKAIQNNGGKVVTWMSKHPILSACTFATVGTLFGPSLLNLANALIRGAMWATDHPMSMLCLLIISIIAVIGFFKLSILTYIKKGCRFICVKVYQAIKMLLKKRVQNKQ